MGRLFWKFFIAFWLAQFISSSIMGIFVGIEYPEIDQMLEQQMGQDNQAVAGQAVVILSPATVPATPSAPGQPSAMQQLSGEEMTHILIDRELSPLSLVTSLLSDSLIFAVLAGLLSWYFTKPIRSLSGAFGAFAAGRMDTRIADHIGRRRDELADLARGFDSMAERLQNTVESQKRLLHDVSHELRSPLARLQVAIELLRQQDDRKDEFIDRIEHETSRMDRLVGELLTLARLGSTTSDQRSELIDMAELLDEVVADAKFEASQKQCRIELRVHGQPQLQGKQELIYRAVENVLRNALHHTPEGGEIILSLDSDGKMITLKVADSGPGVAEENLPMIFEPFARFGTKTTANGYGLGLAIARRVALSHQGTATATNRPSGGLEVTLCFRTDA